MACAPPGRIRYFRGKGKSWELSACTIAKPGVRTQTTLNSSTWRLTWHALRLNVIGQRRLCGGARVFLLMVRESATPARGAGIFPAERLSGRRNTFGFLVSIRKRRSHRSNYFWKQFIRKIDHLLSKA